MRPNPLSVNALTTRFPRSNREPPRVLWSQHSTRPGAVHRLAWDGLLTALVRQVLQTGLEVDMTDHLGYERHAPEGRGSGNSCYGHYPKTVRKRRKRRIAIDWSRARRGGLFGHGRTSRAPRSQPPRVAAAS